MKIMRYLVPNMQEGMLIIKKELGPNAVIIESRKKRQKGIRGLFLPRVLEIMAAVDTHEEKQPVVAEQSENDGKIADEMNQLKQMMQSLISTQKSYLLEEDSDTKYWLNRLIENDVDRGYAEEILADIQNAAAGKKITPEVMEAMILNRLGKIIKTGQIPVKAKYISFVGPTGVGKSTTLAKLAANFTFQQGKKTAIITADTYRIGAVEQLKTYAEITGIPLEVVYTVEEMKETVEKLKDYDLVLIDTAGRSAKNALHIAETAQYLNFLDGVTFLVVSAATKLADLRQIAKAYKRSNYSSLVITKLDETEIYGTIFNACRLTSMPITYITTGQNVPDDLEAAKASELAEMVLGGE